MGSAHRPSFHLLKKKKATGPKMESFMLMALCQQTKTSYLSKLQFQPPRM